MIIERRERQHNCYWEISKKTSKKTVFEGIEIKVGDAKKVLR